MSALIGALAASAVTAQAPVDSPFAYVPRQIVDWYRYHGVDPFLERSRALALHEGLPPRLDPPATDGNWALGNVTMTGTYAATFFVRGIGTLQDDFQYNYVDFTTDRSLTVSTNNFTGLLLAGDPVPTYGLIQYRIQFYRGTSSSIGPAIPGFIQGNDSAINGDSMTLTTAQVTAASGVVTLMVRRRLTIDRRCPGGITLTATGHLTITIN